MFYYWKNDCADTIKFGGGCKQRIRTYSFPSNFSTIHYSFPSFSLLGKMGEFPVMFEKFEDMDDEFAKLLKRINPPRKFPFGFLLRYKGLNCFHLLLFCSHWSWYYLFDCP